MFYDEIQKYDWDETTLQIMSKTDADVRRALGKQRLTIDDFMALACRREIYRTDGTS